MSTDGGDGSALLHLLQLVSPALPVGAYAYSQGLELAVDRGWVSDDTSAENWLDNVMFHNIGHLDGPVFLRLYAAWTASDIRSVLYWNAFLQASRESKELLLEDVQMGAALRRLLAQLDVPAAADWPDEEASYTSMFALAAAHWRIEPHQALRGLVWSWLENQVAAAIRLIPLGQTQGQKLLISLMPSIHRTVRHSVTLDDAELGSSLPRLAMASMQHETQYSRLFRS